MRKSLILAALAVSLFVPRAASASLLWKFYATDSGGAQLVGTCNFAGVGNCNFWLDASPYFGTAAPSATSYTLTNTDFRLDVPVSQQGWSRIFPVDPSLYSFGGMDLHLALHDDQGVAFAGAPSTTPTLSLLEGATIQFTAVLIPTPYLYSLCPSCGGPVNRIFTINSLQAASPGVPALPPEGAIALVGLLYLVVARRLPSASSHSRNARIAGSPARDSAQAT